VVAEVALQVREALLNEIVEHESVAEVLVDLHILKRRVLSAIEHVLHDLLEIAELRLVLRDQLGDLVLLIGPPVLQRRPL